MTRSGNNRNVFNCDYREIRTNITTFLSLLRRRLFEICIKSKPIDTEMESKNENSFCISVIKQMKGLLLFIGRLSQIRPQLIRLAVNSDSKTSIFNYFHSCLDIWWTAIEMMHILDQNNKINLNDLALIKDQISGKLLSSQSIELVLFDLIVFSVNRFNETKSVNKYQSLSLFDCLCVKQMYVLVRHMFNAINNCMTNDNFFQQIFSTLSLLNTDSNKSYPIKDFKTIAFGSNSVEDSSLHFIWFVTNIVQTFNYDITGQLTHNSNLHSIPTLLLRKITLFLRQSDSNSIEKLSAIIMLCLNSIDFWKPNTDLILPFTEYFLKNLIKSYCKTSVEDLAVIPKNSIKWHQIVREISSDRNHSFKDNSFHLFLSLMSQKLSIVFTKCEPKTKLMNWQKLKGKVVVNLPPNRIKHLDETSVYNLLSFYLVLLNSNQQIWTDFIDFVFETIDRLINSQNSMKNTELVMKFLFTLISNKPKEVNSEKVITFVGKLFNSLCEQRIKSFANDFNKRFSNLIIIFFDELKILLKTNHLFENNFHKLLDIKFLVFSSPDITYEEKIFVINFISDLLKQIDQKLCSEKKGFETQMISVINTCFESILPFIKQEIIQKTDYQILSQISYSLTRLSLIA